jgi:hypothetical protein
VDRPADLSKTIAELFGILVDRWKASYENGNCRLDISDRGETVVTRRYGAHQTVFTLSPLAAQIHDRLSKPVRLASILANWESLLPAEPFRHAAFLDEVEEIAHRRESLVTIGGSTFDCYKAMLLHGLVLQEEGWALAVACRAEVKDTHQGGHVDMRVPILA